MGTHDRSSDGVSPDRLQPRGVGRGRRDCAADPAPTRHREVGEPVHAPALAGGTPDKPGARSGRREGRGRATLLTTWPPSRRLWSGWCRDRVEATGRDIRTSARCQRATGSAGPTCTWTTTCASLACNRDVAGGCGGTEVPPVAYFVEAAETGLIVKRQFDGRARGVGGARPRESPGRMRAGRASPAQAPEPRRRPPDPTRSG